MGETKNMIDKNGKVFGKINIVDLIVIVVIIAAVVMFAVSRFGGQNDGASVEDGKSIYMSFYAEEVSDFVVDKIEEGAKLYDDDHEQVLGEVVKVETAPAVIYLSDSDGKSVASSKENYKSVIITAKVNGTLSDYGFELGGVKYGVGHSMTLRAGYAKIFMRVYDVFSE